MVIPLNPHQFPSSKARLMNGDGTATDAFYFFLQALYNRGGGNTGIITNSMPAMTAAGGTQVTATQLTHDYSEVLAGSGGVRMTAVQPGQQHRIYNGTGGNINIYPPLGGQIDGLGVNQPYSLPTGKSQQIWASSIMTNGGTQYRSIILG